MPQSGVPCKGETAVVAFGKRKGWLERNRQEWGILEILFADDSAGSRPVPAHMELETAVAISGSSKKSSFG